MLCSHAVSDHDRHRGCKAKGAGTADHKDRNAACQGKSNALSGKKPDHNGCQGDRDDGRNEDAGYPVSYLCNRRLCSRCIAYHLDDLGEGSVLAYARGLAFNKAGLV